MMNLSRTLLAGAAIAGGLLVAALPASATTIDFNTLGGSSGDIFTTYTEGGFTVTTIAGEFDKAISGSGFIGDPKPSIYASDGTVKVTQVGGGTFDLSGLDLANYDSPPKGTYIITGYLGLTSVFSETGKIANPGTDDGFATYATTYSGDVIDSLTINIESDHTSNLDNIVLDPVAATPEPGSLILLGTGLLGLGAAARRRLFA